MRALQGSGLVLLASSSVLLGCASSELILPTPTSQPVRMMDIGPAEEGASMTMAAGVREAVSNTLSSSATTSVQSSSTQRSSGAFPSASISSPTQRLPSTTLRSPLRGSSSVTTTSGVVPLEVPDARPPLDAPVLIVTATVEILEVFDDMAAPRSRWLLPNPGPGVAQRTLITIGNLVEGQEWIRVAVPVRPNGTQGWVRNRDVHVSTVQAKILIDLTQGWIEAWHNGQLLSEGSIVSGGQDTPTPSGQFFITEIKELVAPTDGAATWLIGTSAFSEAGNLEIDGDPGIAILDLEGSPNGLLEHSRGCIRVPAKVLETLARLPLGTPVEILE